MAKRSASKPLTGVGAETVRQFHQRLHAEGRYEEYLRRQKELMLTEKLTQSQARSALASEFGAEHGVLGPAAGRRIKEKDGSYLETMNWVATALGWMKEGRPVSRLNAPGPKAWAMFQWAGQDEKSQDKFWAMWSQSNKRAADETAGANETARLQESELLAMLAEIDAEVA